MKRTIHSIKDKVLKTVKKSNNNKSSKYFGKEFVIIECEKNNITVQQDENLISKENLATVFDANKILGKTLIFRCIKVKNDYILTEIEW